LTERPAIFWAGLISIFVLLAVASVRYQPPPPRPATAPANEFSGVRARAAYQRALGEPTPHWVGSPHDAEIRERIVAQLRELGYAPESIEGVSCGSNRGCGKTVSIVARREGREK